MAAEKASKSKVADIDEKLRHLPDGGDALPTIHDAAAHKILELAETLVFDARKRLGSESSKPRVAEVKALFTEHTGRSPKVSDELNRELRRPDRVERVAGLDQTWDKVYAKAINVFDQTSIESGSKVQEAIDNWQLAVRVYKAEARSASAIFRAAIETAHEKQRHEGGRHAGVDRLSDHYTSSVVISAALVTYEKSMATAIDALSIAVGALTKDLFTSTSSVSVAEATLIDTEQKASKAFWSGVQDEFENRS
ncbi:hypothetical protein [Ruegeria sp.]|uniref:hypothetical protein n=1 Tax=Ruegeria sp. TaxID=1879320 RepID=UPI002323FEC1|nr:hypothetical protein [Ruegeria sp.]MDA7966957.1 hypothetical protein [Ruegeria sp.]